ncbi:MAG TPA: molybdopterin oxidoreductase family protein, partial [Blastocatellia bacterium]|nr:molybdopterin oxidoreductase family protein [Blastocatellia bacterium]
MDHVATHCPYCALQCGMTVAMNGSISITGNPDFPVNEGALCIKGWSAAETLGQTGRLLHPLARNRRGVLARVSWDEALARTAKQIRESQSFGRDSVGVFGGGSLTNEKAYLLGKFARVALGTANIDYNGRFCMSSAAAAANKAFGIDRGLPFPLEDIPNTEAILLVGSNVAETMPPFMKYFAAHRALGGKLVVVDPRLTTTAEDCDLLLRVTPGSDIALANGLMHILIRAGLIDQNYIDERTDGFEHVKNLAATYWPDRVERMTGVPESRLLEAARIIGEARSAMVLTARGPEQQSNGVNNVLAYINLALALGLVGKPFSGYGSLTGQGNGQGGREHGQKADQLPGYRKIDDPKARKHVASVWGIRESDLPGPGRSAYEMLDSLGTDGGVRTLLVMGSNVAVSAPRSTHVAERLKSLDFLAVSDFFLSETAEFADVVFPSAQWAEEDGTMTNLEGRVIRRRRAVDPPGEVLSDIDTICELAKALGFKDQFSYNSARAVFDELRRASAGGLADYSGITYEKIDEHSGVFWPCPAEDHPGTPRLFETCFPTPSGRARFHAVRDQLPAELPDESFPLYLTTGRVLAHYQSGTQTRRVAHLTRIASEPCAEIHPAVARRAGLTEGDKVLITSRRGTAEFSVSITAGIREDTVFVPFHWSGSRSANNLTNPVLDPTSRMPEFKVCSIR